MFHERFAKLMLALTCLPRFGRATIRYCTNHLEDDKVSVFLSKVGRTLDLPTSSKAIHSASIVRTRLYLLNVYCS